MPGSKTKITEQVTAKAGTMYNDYRFGDFNYGSAREKLDPLFFKFISKAKKDEKVFDIGCGAGYWLSVCVREGISKENVVGVDLAPSNVEELQKKDLKLFAVMF